MSHAISKRKLYAGLVVAGLVVMAVAFRRRRRRRWRTRRLPRPALPCGRRPQTTTEWATLIGPRKHRVWVGTDIPGAEIPGKNSHDVVVWGDAASGRELARSDRVPAMTQGSAIQPGYGGSVYFPSSKGTLFKLTPHAVG